MGVPIETPQPDATQGQFRVILHYGELYTGLKTWGSPAMILYPVSPGCFCLEPWSSLKCPR